MKIRVKMIWMARTINFRKLVQSGWFNDIQDRNNLFQVVSPRNSAMNGRMIKMGEAGMGDP